MTMVLPLLNRLDSNLSTSYSVRTDSYGDLYNLEQVSGINSLISDITLVFS